MSENAVRAGLVVTGLIVGGLVGYGLAGTKAGDDDRPPIIVRGGSLIFQSGDPSSSEEEERIGKPWIAAGSDWQPDHPAGRAIKRFYVVISGGNPQFCPALSQTKEVTVTYTGPEGDKQFLVTMKKEGGGLGDPQAPTIVGQELTATTGQNPQLVHGTAGQGSIKNVRFQAQGIGNVSCDSPTSLKIWQE